MPEYVEFLLDTGKIIQKYYSVDPKVVEGKPNCLEIPRDLFNSLTEYHIVDAGQVRIMTQTEKDAYNQIKVEAQKQELLAQIDNYEVSNIDLITALVKRINVRIPSNPITKIEIVEQLKKDKGLIQ